MMPLSTSAERRQIEINSQMTQLVSQYLQESPKAITREMLRSLMDTCSLNENQAYYYLLCSLMGLDLELPKHRHLAETYIEPALKALSAMEYCNDRYYQEVQLPEFSDGHWTLKWESFQPYELIIYDDYFVKEGVECPCLGYFTEEYRYPCLYENGVEWMTITPSEINTMKPGIRAAAGRVLVCGLGLGYYAFHIAQKSEVESITIVERDPAVIALFTSRILPQFPQRKKLTWVCQDAYDYVDQMDANQFDFVFVDLWHNAADGTDLMLKMMEREPRFPDTRFCYWLQTSLESVLRWRRLQEQPECKV